ncbi:uncharacterized protein LOC121419615 [Lytechinus variegatus]|uniref:uncharacterized protein LOC121419615 n=1 Tax=Lytechinus variegatus TaxID=7654 RepID=UPI001BB1A283|nr:uncharacterized protein LOC121419615 [Lytechinus variegatus]
MDSKVVGQNLSKLRVYGPPDDAYITIPADLQDGMETNVTCRTSNGYPAHLIHWYVGSRNLTDNSSLESSLNIAGRYDAVSTLTFVPKRVYHGQRLLCQAVQPETPFGRSLNDSMVLNIYKSDANPPAFKVKWFCDCTELQGCHNTSFNDTLIEGDTVNSAELTIGKPRSGDHCEFTCVAISTFGEGTAVLSSSFYAPPNGIIITTGRGNRFYCNNLSIMSLTVMAEAPYSITCEASQARPPALLQWHIPDDMAVIHQDQADVIQYGSYNSHKALTIIPSRNDQGKILSCIASHPELQNDLRCSISLMVQVWPKNVLLFSTGINQSQSYEIYVQEDSPTSITCKSIGTFPAVELALDLLCDSGIIPIKNSSRTPNLFDQKLFDTETTIKIRPTKTDHGKYIQCYAFMDSEVVGQNLSKLRVYGLPDDANITIHADLHDGMETNVTCRTSNGYPPPLIHWYIGSRNLTDNSSLNYSLNSADRYDGVSTLIFVPRRFDYGKRLFCQAVQPETPLGRSLNYSMVLNISYGPFASITSRRLIRKGIHVGYVLKCTSDANPPAFKIQWFCDCTELQDCHNKTVNGTMIEGETVTSTELAIGNPLLEDHCEFRCIAISTDGSGTAVLNSFYVAPNSVFIKDGRGTMNCVDNLSVRLTAQKQLEITCQAGRARPPPILEWQLPDTTNGFTAVIDHQYDVVQDGSYISQRSLRFTPSRNDQGKILICVASHPELTENLQCSVHLIFHVPPSGMRIFLAGSGMESLQTFLNVNEDLPTTITCKTIASFPATELSWILIGTNGSNPINANVSNTHNMLDDNLFDTESTITIHPDKMDHGNLIQCYISLDGAFVDILTATLRVIGHHAFEVSIQTDSIPIIGVDFTLVCSFTPETRYKQLVWKKGENIQVASHSCWRSLYYCPVNSIPFPLKFSLKTDNSSGNLTIRNLNEDDISDYRCSLSSGEISGSAIKQVKPLTPGMLFIA